MHLAYAWARQHECCKDHHRLVGPGRPISVHIVQSPGIRERILDDVNQLTLDYVEPIGGYQGMAVLTNINQVQSDLVWYTESLASQWISKCVRDTSGGAGTYRDLGSHGFFLVINRAQSFRSGASGDSHEGPTTSGNSIFSPVVAPNQ